jgi:hypothetical protein
MIELITIKILFIICLFLAVWWTPINIAKLIWGQDIENGNFLMQAIGITGTILYFMWIKNLI